MPRRSRDVQPEDRTGSNYVQPDELVVPIVEIGEGSVMEGPEMEAREVEAYAESIKKQTQGG